MFISRLRVVTDIEDGARSFPDPGLVFYVQPMGVNSEKASVSYVERRGDHLVARGHDGQDYAITGVGAYTIKATRVGR